MPCGSSFSALPPSPVRGGPIRFSLWGERYRGVVTFSRLGGKLCPSCVVPYEPPAVLAAHLNPRSSCVCWGHHLHRRRHDLASCLQTRLHHLYWGRHHHVHCPRRCWYQHCRRLLASFMVCSCQSLLHHPRSSWLLWSHLPAQYLPLQRCPRPHRFWALGLAARAFSGSW